MLLSSEYLAKICTAATYINMFLPSFSFSVNVSLCMLAKLGPKWEMHAGSFTVWSTVSSRMDRCPVIRQ